MEKHYCKLRKCLRKLGKRYVKHGEKVREDGAWQVGNCHFSLYSHQKSQHTKDGSSTGGRHTWQLWIKERYMVT